MPGERRPGADMVMDTAAGSEDENALLMSVPGTPRRQTGPMLWRGVGSVLAGCGAGTLVLLVVWIWPGQNVPPSMGPVVVVPFLHGPTPSATAPPGPGRPAVSPAPPPASPAPSGTCSGGRAVSPPPPPESDDKKDGSREVPGGGGAAGASRATDDDEKASRVPRGDVGDEEDEPDDGDEEASHGSNRGDADAEWDD